MATPDPTAPVCFRHPERQTWITCQRCGRPICPDCMVPAAVGFQCPECVTAGARATRSGRLPYGGTPSSNPVLTSVVIIAINVAVWLAVVADRRLVDALALLPHGGVRRSDAGMLEMIDGVATGAWWQVISNGFTHIEFFHIGMNMVALYFLGPPLESVLGRLRFLTVYAVSLLTASATVMLFSDPHAQTLGASGAIFGLLGALAVIAYKVRGNVSTIGTWLVINLIITFTVPNISWQGHLGGLIGGALLAAAFVFAPRARRARVQWGTAAALAGLSIVMIVVRALQLGPLI